MELKANPGKNLIIKVKDKKYARYPVKTHLILEKEDYAEIIKKYAGEFLRPGDVVFISEKSLASSQGRSYSMESIKPGWLARFLVRFVTKSPYGIGIGSPETMQLVVEEVNFFRLTLAVFLAAVTKPLGIKGIFYRIAGTQARAIDGAVDYAIPPYNARATKAPLSPEKTAQEISRKIGFPVAIVDACDLGIWVLGKSKEVDEKLVIAALKDNPLGQSSEQTPFGILRFCDYD
jgi:F420-0:gamma-glutamyl ligase-like protein